MTKATTKSFHTIATVIVLSGCSPLIVTTATESTLIKEPKEGVITIANVGDVIYQESDYTTHPTAKIASQLKVGIGKVVSIKENMLTLSSTPDGHLVYCGLGNIILSFAPNTEMPVCLEDTHKTGRFDRIFYMSTNNSETINEPQSYTKISKLQRGNKQEIIYNGIVGSSANLSYREYRDDFTKPSSTQTITYRLEGSNPTEGRFRGLKIKIFSSDNHGIKYSVSGSIKPQ